MSEILYAACCVKSLLSTNDSESQRVPRAQVGRKRSESSLGYGKVRWPCTDISLTQPLPYTLVSSLVNQTIFVTRMRTHNVGGEKGERPVHETTCLCGKLLVFTIGFVPTLES